MNHLQNINAQINIPAGQTRTYTETETLPATDYTFLSAFPHMHLIGTTIKSWANKPSTNDTIRFVNIPKWDFQWQDTYIFPNAVKVPAGSTLRAVATYDNTTNNPYHLNQTVVAGEATTEEMMMVFFGFMPYVNGDENLIVDRRILPQGATTFCNGQSVELKMIEGSGYTYQWYRNGTAINGATSFSYTAAQDGNYHALITLGTNNSLTDTIAVNIASAPLASVIPNGSTALCAGSNVTLNAATGSGYSYQWFNSSTPILNATSSSYTASATGSYRVQVYNGCYANSSAVSVTSMPAPSNTVTQLGATSFCQGGNVILSAPAGLSYQWSNNAATQNITVTQNGSYTVTVTNGNNCTAVSLPTAVTVNSLPPASVTPSGTTTFCQGGNVILSAPSGFTYNWNNSAMSQTITVAQSGVFNVTVTNANNCSAVSAATTVTVHALPNASITPSGLTSFCAGESVMLTVPTNVTYQWSSSAATQSINVNQSGNYSVTVTNANNCSNTASISVSVYPLPNAIVTSNQPTSICPGDSVTLSAAAGMSYNWSNNATTQSITVSTAGVFIVTVTNNNSCSASSIPDTVVISNSAVAGITPSGSTAFCEGGSVQLTASSGTVYQWSNNATTQSITVNASGSFVVTVTMSGSCTAVSSPVNVIVNQNPSVPAVTTSGPAVFCEGSSVDLIAPSGYNYQWSSGEITSSITVTQADNYIVTVTDVNSCSASSTPTVVTVNNLPTVALSGNTGTLCSSESAIILSEGVPAGGTFSGVGVTGNLFDPLGAGVGIHTVTYSYTDNNGCIGIANETIEVTVCSAIRNIDNEVFSIYPNPSEGYFLVQWNGANAPNTAIKIFAISGKLIYSSVIEKLQTAINLEGVFSGCYLLQLKTQNQTFYQKLIVQE